MLNLLMRSAKLHWDFGFIKTGMDSILHFTDSATLNMLVVAEDSQSLTGCWKAAGCLRSESSMEIASENMMHLWIGRESFVIISVILTRRIVPIRNAYVSFLGMDTRESISDLWSLVDDVRSCALERDDTVEALTM